MDELIRQRLRQAGLVIPVVPDPLDGEPSRIVQVYNGGSIPTATPRVYLCHPVSVSSNELEGATPSLATDTGSTLAVLVFGSAPIAGDKLVARMIGDRWVAAKGGRTLTHHVNGCIASLAGASIEYQLGGITLYSGTTDGSGNVVFTLPTGTYTVVINKGPRFATYTGSVTITSATSLVTTTLSPATDYYCTSICNEPLYKRLYLSDSVYGLSGVILDHVGSVWSSNNSNAPHRWGSNYYYEIAYPGCGGCLAPTESTGIIYIFSGAGTVRVLLPSGLVWNGSEWIHCPIALGSGDEVGPFDFLEEVYGVGSLTCPPSAFYRSVAVGSGGTDHAYCTDGTLTITE